MNIELGEYARTKFGYIAKVKEVEDGEAIWFDNVIHFCYEPVYTLFCEDIYLITKHSFNIIDLIEIRRLCEW